jgi:hypothetical protein
MNVPIGPLESVLSILEREAHVSQAARLVSRPRCVRPCCVLSTPTPESRAVSTLLTVQKATPTVSNEMIERATTTTKKLSLQKENNGTPDTHGE